MIRTVFVQNKVSSLADIFFNWVVVCESVETMSTNNNDFSEVTLSSTKY